MSKRSAIALGVVALVAAVGLLVFLIVSGTDDGDGDEVTTGTDQTTTTTEAPTSTTSTTLFEQGQGPIVAVNAAGQVVLLDPESGEQRFVLFEGVDVSDPAKNAVSISPADGSVYVVRPVEGDAAATPEIVRVPLRRDETPEPVTTGYAPAVSPDGESLAYVQVAGTGPDAKPVLVVRNIETGKERRFETPAGEPGFAFIPDMAWAPTGNVVLFIAGEIKTGLYSLDVARAASLGDARRLGPAVESAEGGGDVAWFTVTPLGARLAVGEWTGGLPDRDHRILEVDLQGEVRGTVRDTTPSFFRLDSRTGGGVLLYVADAGPDGGRLLRLRPGEEPQELATDIIVATW